jgi:glutamine cyclotransferase
VAKVDFTKLANEAKSLNPNELEMNGIAYDSLKNEFLITGKFWPKVYRVRMK